MNTLFPRNTVALLFLCLTVAWPAAAQETDSTMQDTTMQAMPEPLSAEAQDEVQQVADGWLALLDESDMAQSYEAASQLLRDQVTQEQWEQSIGSARGQSGALESRTFTAVRQVPAPPQAPPGEYAAAQYLAKYANFEAQEMVVFFKEDGTWKPAGYFVQPTSPPTGTGDPSGAMEDTTGGAMSDTTGVQ